MEPSVLSLEIIYLSISPWKRFTHPFLPWKQWNFLLFLFSSQIARDCVVGFLVHEIQTRKGKY